MANVETWDEDVRKKLGDNLSAKVENLHQHQQQGEQQLMTAGKRISIRGKFPRVFPLAEV